MALFSSEANKESSIIALDSAARNKVITINKNVFFILITDL